MNFLDRRTSIVAQGNRISRQKNSDSVGIESPLAREGGLSWTSKHHVHERSSLSPPWSTAMPEAILEASLMNLNTSSALLTGFSPFVPGRFAENLGSCLVAPGGSYVLRSFDFAALNSASLRWPSRCSSMS